MLIACNNTPEPQTFTVEWHGETFYYVLPVNTIATFRRRDDGN